MPPTGSREPGSTTPRRARSWPVTWSAPGRRRSGNAASEPQTGHLDCIGTGREDDQRPILAHDEAARRKPVDVAPEDAGEERVVGRWGEVREHEEPHARGDGLARGIGGRRVVARDVAEDLRDAR